MSPPLRPTLERISYGWSRCDSPELGLRAGEMRDALNGGAPTVRELSLIEAFEWAAQFPQRWNYIRKPFFLTRRPTEAVIPDWMPNHERIVEVAA